MTHLTRKNKHLTLDMRIEIQECLNKGMTFKAIGQLIGKDQTTISKEVKKHILTKPSTVSRTDSAGRPVSPLCPLLLKAPFVCNACKRRHTRCSYDKQLYEAKRAQREYETLLSQAREGIPLTKSQFYEMDRLVSDRLRQGQHLYHILQSNDLGVSKSTIYRHLKRGYLSVAATDFPRIAKFKPRKKPHSAYVPKGLKVGRSYEDFTALIHQEAIRSWVEMDTVIGRIGGKTILTFDFTFCNFMPAFLLDDKSAASVSKAIRSIKNSLANRGRAFGEIFPLILTDNGSEFSDLFTIENSLDGSKECSLYFCDPYQSSQKPKVEKNHTLFRDIVPKGTSFDTFSQQTVSLVFSHVNSVKRKLLNGKTPYEVFAYTFGEDVAAAFGIVPIPADEVIQSPKLIQPFL